VRSVERSVDISTGESVAFSYELAGLGSRFIAVALDFTIQISVALAVFLIFAWIAYGLPNAPPVTLTTATKVATAILEGIIVFAAFLLFFGYFIFFEWLFEGRTPGKRLTGLRVVRDGGFPLDFTSAVVRNVVRILEFGIGFYAISAVATVLSPMNRRLGDMAAGTLVVREGKLERSAVLPVYASEERRDDSLARDLSPAERELVRRYVERRETLKAGPRDALAKRIADGIRPRLAATFAHLSDDDLLVHVEEALR
jgi:uncharacterized RDD family membrane protein YckC